MGLRDTVGRTFALDLFLLLKLLLWSLSSGFAREQSVRALRGVKTLTLESLVVVRQWRREHDRRHLP